MDNSNFSNLLHFLIMLRSIRNFNNNVKDKTIKNSAFSVLIFVFFLINFRDYIQVLSLRIRANPPHEINDFKNNTIDPCRFTKFNSIQPFITYLFDIDTKILKKNDPRIGVFTRNLEDRGVDSLGNNLKKREYYSAFNLEKIPYYDTHINDLFKSLDKDSIKNKPLLSSFSNHLVTYFLNIHLGIPNNKQMKRPKVVFDYFSDILKVIALQPTKGITKINPNNIRFVVSIKNKAPAVKEYFKKRIDEIIKERPMDNSIVVTNWLTSGFDADSVQIAAFHNIVAFSQFLNTLSLTCLKLSPLIYYNN